MFDIVKSSLKNSITDVFKSLSLEIFEVMDNVGECKEEYHLKIYPFELERIDGGAIPEKLLIAIRDRLRIN